MVEHQLGVAHFTELLHRSSLVNTAVFHHHLMFFLVFALKKTLQSQVSLLLSRHLNKVTDNVEFTMTRATRPTK
jgi:hypothetical protein